MAAAPHGDGTEPAAPRALDAVHDALRERAALLVHHGDGVQVVMLEPGHAIVLGRDAPSAVRIADRALSRAHARFTLIGRTVRVEDQGSTNGTWIADQRVSAAEVAAGTEVKLGSVVVRVHLFARSDGPAANVGPDRPASSGGDVVIGSALGPLFETAARVANSKLSVLVQGETGTGKEVLARHLHERSPRASKPFVAVNCGAIPGQLVESTLFGHERGAFTGAFQQHKGVFEAAHGGTVFLDEIGELAPAVQAALLLVLENGRFCRVGSTREVSVDARVVAASHADLEAMVAQGRFRADLYYRLQGAVLRLPPLRDRKEDIGPLVEKLIERANAHHGRRVVGIAKEALAALSAHDWPGNVRELRNAVDHAVVIAKGPVLVLEDLPAHLRAGSPSSAVSPSSTVSALGVGGAASAPGTTRAVEEAPGAAATEGEAGDDEGATDDTSEGAGGELRARVDRYEARLIREALEAAGFRRAEAARALGLPLRTLARRIKLLGIKEPR